MSSNNISKNNSTIFTTKNNELAIFGQTLDDIREKLINFNDVIMQGGTFGSSKKQLIPENELTKIISNDEAKSIVDTLNSINDKTNETWDSTDSYLTFLKGKGKGYVTDYVKANQNQVYITEDVIQASKDARAAQIAQNEAVKEGTLDQKFTLSSSASSFKIVNNSDLAGIIYPLITITPKSSGNLILNSGIDGDMVQTQIKGVTSNSKIILDGKNDYYEGISDPNKFNYKFPVLDNVYNDRNTYFKLVSGSVDCDIILKYRYIRMVKRIF